MFNKREKLATGLREFLGLFNLAETFPWTSGYEPAPDKESVRAMAKRQGQSMLETAYDFMASGGILWRPQAGTYNGDMDAAYQFFQNEYIIPGFADGGAHATMIQDAVAATHSLTHWARDRTRGPKLPVELLVKKQTADVAQLFGLSDRGVIAVGKKADINVIDFKKLMVRPPRMVRDLPLGQQRWTQDVDGYVLTLLSGRATFRAGAPTGVLPGQLVRNPRRRPEAWKGAARKFSAPFDGELPKIADDEQDRVLDGLGSKGGSAAARLLRSTVEAEDTNISPRARL